ncbi:hypothetical protein ACHAXM_006585 [Skeletonema potamos]
MLQEDTSNAIRMNSLDKYDKIYAKYSNAIEGRGKCDPPLFRDPPGHTSDPTEEVVHIKAGTNSVPYITPAPQREVTPPKVLLPDTTSLSIQGCILSRYHQDPPELKNPVASRDDDITPAKQSDKQCSRDEESVQSKLDRFNAKRMSLRSIYGSPSALTTASSKLSSGGDPPSDAIDSRLAFLTEQSMARRAIYATISPSTSKSDRDAKPKETHKWISATISFPHMIPSSSPSLPMKSLAMRLISEQMIDDYRMIQDKCSDCANYMLEAYDGSGIRKCVFCPINDFRAIIQGAVSNRVMAAKRIQGEQALLVSDGQCEHCYSPTHEGNSCEVCPILDEICIEVARAIGHGGTLSDSSCNDCGSQHVKSSSGEMQCLVCNVLHQKLGDQQIYKPGKTFASTSSIKSYQDTLDDTTQLLETIKLQDNSSVQIKLDEELVQAKNAQTLLETTIGNIAYEKKTSGIRTELKAELLKAKEAQLALQKMLESNNPPSTDTTQIIDANSSDDASRVSHAITQREIVAGNVKEYIPPPKHFFQRGVPKTIWFEQRPRGEISVGTSHYTNDLKQSTMHNERRPVADCCGVRINKEPSYDDGSELFDDGSIGTDDEYTVDISLNSYNSKSAARNESRKHRGQRDIREKKTSKGRWRRWSIFDLCGRPPSFDDASEEQDTGHDDLYHTGYRPHHKYSFDNEELYHRALRAKIRRDDDSSHASMYSNITPPGILRRARYRDRSQSASFSVMTDDRSRMSHRRRERRSPSPGNSASSSEYRKVSFYKNHHRDLDIDKLKTLTEEGDDSFRSDHPNHAVSRVRRSIAEYKSLSHEMNDKSLSHEMNEVSGLY